MIVEQAKPPSECAECKSGNCAVTIGIGASAPRFMSLCAACRDILISRLAKQALAHHQLNPRETLNTLSKK